MNRSQAIFHLHIPKCAGTSVRNALETAIGDEAALSAQRHSGTLEPDKALYSGHFSALAVPDDFEGMTFTVLREPWTRLVSAYRFLRSHTEDYARAENLDLALLARNASLEEFLSSRCVIESPFFNNPYCRLLQGAPLPRRWEQCHHRSLAPLNAFSLHRVLQTVDRRNIRIFFLDRLNYLETSLAEYLETAIQLSRSNETNRKSTVDPRFDPPVDEDDPRIMRKTPRLLERSEPLLRYDLMLYALLKSDEKQAVDHSAPKGG